MIYPFQASVNRCCNNTTLLFFLGLKKTALLNCQVTIPSGIFAKNAIGLPAIHGAHFVPTVRIFNGTVTRLGNFNLFIYSRIGFMTPRRMFHFTFFGTHTYLLAHCLQTLVTVGTKTGCPSIRLNHRDNITYPLKAHNRL